MPCSSPNGLPDTNRARRLDCLSMNNKPATARDVVGEYLGAVHGDHRLREPAARRRERHSYDPGAVRRLRSTIRVFTELFDPEAGHLEEELIWWAGLLGKVRDMDILAQRQAACSAELTSAPSIDHPGRAGCAAQAGNGCNARGAGLRALPQAGRPGASLAQRSTFTAAADASPDSIDSAIRKARKKVTSGSATRLLCNAPVSLPMSCSIVPARHPNVIVMQWSCLPVWGSKADKIISQRKDLQDVLGNHQDSIVSAAFLRELGGRLGIRSGQNGFSYGVLYAREIYAGDSLLDELKPFLLVPLGPELVLARTRHNVSSRQWETASARLK